MWQVLEVKAVGRVDGLIIAQHGVIQRNGLFICSRSNRYFMAWAKSGLMPGPMSLRMMRSEYWPDCVVKMA